MDPVLCKMKATEAHLVQQSHSARQQQRLNLQRVQEGPGNVLVAIFCKMDKGGAVAGALWRVAVSRRNSPGRPALAQAEAVPSWVWGDDQPHVPDDSERQ